LITVSPRFDRVNTQGRCLVDSPSAVSVRATIGCMQIILLAMKLLEILFFVGLAGSSVVVFISFIEDGRELFGKDE
jgi:hypothetical protein